MAVPFDAKDPDEKVDRELDWQPRLATGETVAASTWIVPTGITKDSDDFDDAVTIIRLSGGSERTKYSLVNRITTSTGQVLDQTATIKVKTK